MKPDDSTERPAPPPTEDRPHRCVFRRLCERLVTEYEMDDLGDMDAVVEQARKALRETP